jgi:hypothetical protein
MPDILIRDVSDAVVSALARRAERENRSRADLIMATLEQLAVVEVEPGKVRLDFRHPQAPSFVWGHIHCDLLRLRADNGASGYINAYGAGGGQGMSQELHAAKQLAADHINKARVFQDETIGGVDIVALLEAAGWEVFPG